MNLFSRYAPALFFATLGCVTILALMPGPTVPHAIQFWDKAQHALAFSVLAILGCCAFPRRSAHVAIGLLAHGALIEILQATLTTTRTGDVLDWLADSVGISLGLALYLMAAAKLAPSSVPAGGVGE